MDEDGEVVVEYVYSDWGELFLISGSLAEAIGEVNPFRYRGYVYAEETGLYYVSSMYDDPEVGRFINADDIGYLGADGSLIGFNLFL